MLLESVMLDGRQSRESPPRRRKREHDGHFLPKSKWAEIVRQGCICCVVAGRAALDRPCWSGDLRSCCKYVCAEVVGVLAMTLSRSEPHPLKTDSKEEGLNTFRLLNPKALFAAQVDVLAENVCPLFAT
jgi:hypothetical protein